MHLPILMYHKVDRVPAHTRHLDNYVTPAQFDEQLSALGEWGFRGVTLDDWVEARRTGRLASGEPFPPRAVAITFDDGYRSFIDVALPRLQRSAFPATVFVVSDRIGATNAWDEDERQEPLLSARELLDVRRAGIHIGSHSRTHRALARIPAADAAAELSESRQALEATLGEPVRTLAYPYNNQSVRVRRLARDAGYVAAVMGRGRTNTRWRTCFGLYRLRVDLRTTLASLRASLEHTPVWPF